MTPQVIVIEYDELMTFDFVSNAELYIGPYDLDYYEVFGNVDHWLNYVVHGSKIVLEGPSPGASCDGAVLITAVWAYLRRLGCAASPGKHCGSFSPSCIRSVEQSDGVPHDEWI